MNEFFRDLRRTREAKRMSLTDIADATLINVKYLEAIEQGNVSILPEPYVRAFIREYASAVGLDPAETIRRFDRSVQAGTPPRDSLPLTPPPASPFRTWTRLRLTPGNVVIGGGVLVLITVVLILWRTGFSGSSPTVKEIPFQAVVKESERRAAPAVKPPPGKSQPTDSITLVASVSDTVWMTVASDSLPSREYLFWPGARATWRARDRFILTLGNAGGVSFALNKRQLGALGRRGTVLRNVAITRQRLSEP
jgi:cytoskeletal protein RodZ